MSYDLEKIEKLSLQLPVTQAARRIAERFSRQQPTLKKVEQVRLNTLAVCVVHDYLQMMGIPTNLKASDSWNPAVRLCCNVADLEIVGLGRLECRYIEEHQQTCYIPPEVSEDRLGYVVVQLDESLLTATMLGFASTAATEQLHISQLQPLEALLTHLHQLRQSSVVTQAETTTKTLVNLNQWLQNVFEAGWEKVEALLMPTASPAFSFRKVEPVRDTNFSHLDTKVRRAKLIDLGMQLAGHSVALIVELKPESDQKTGILLQVHPTESQTFLPPLLQLVVIDESGANFLEAKARRADNYIQLQFSGRPGERFSVKVALDNISITENFVI